MNSLVTLDHGKALASSKAVADKFGKEHRYIMNTIKKIVKSQPEFGSVHFTTSSYVSDQNKVLDCFEMTKDGFCLLAMGLTGKEALAWKIKYMEAFNSMEKSILNIDFRMNQLTKEQGELTETGQAWSKMGLEIKAAKKENKRLSSDLTKEVQFELGLEGE